jgi:hypothetical protein
MAAIDAEHYLDDIPEELDESTDIADCSLEPTKS